jgi:hypothetical protein
MYYSAWGKAPTTKNEGAVSAVPKSKNHSRVNFPDLVRLTSLRMLTQLDFAGSLWYRLWGQRDVPQPEWTSASQKH